MNSFFARLERNGAKIALQDSTTTLTYIQLSNRVNALAEWLVASNVRSIALLADNSVEWVVTDLACQKAQVVCTPIPVFFTHQQSQAIITSVAAEFLFSSQEDSGIAREHCDYTALNVTRLQPQANLLVPPLTSKVTYTSGSTGTPKGVCLSAEQQHTVARSLAEFIGINQPQHLCLLPLPVLLENVAGVYAPLLAGGSLILASQEERGFSGSTLTNPKNLLECIETNQPNTLILVPELLQVLVRAAGHGWQPPKTLQFVAVGGSRVAPTLIQRARAIGIPVVQGYGLSECASVVSLCAPDDDVSSVGQILPHLSARLENSELVVSGNTFLGYLEQPDSWHQHEVHTGDVAQLKGNQLAIIGRRKNTLINSLGRNISPEWVEAEILATGLFFQAVVVGDAMPFCTAILVPARRDLSAAHIDQVIAMVNQGLPDYARVYHPIIQFNPMQPEEGLYTQNMRPRRAAIYQHFKQQIQRVYASTSTVEQAL
ncbi:AMP-binding protein [Alteromonas flava]|uniref:AMP-binding protein n=1 Tax=Alteromonas flava TaxID=2048003 RepID=UPI000C284344|nr:AMP-binding protein [Alteromonas flava]